MNRNKQIKDSDFFEFSLLMITILADILLKYLSIN